MLRIRDFSAVIAPGFQFDFINIIVPSNQHYVLKEFGNDLSIVGGWTFAQWQILINGIPTYPMNAIFDQMGYAAQRQKVEGIVMRGGDRFQVRGLMDGAGPAGCAVLVSIAYEEVDND